MIEFNKSQQQPLISVSTILKKRPVSSLNPDQAQELEYLRAQNKLLKAEIEASKESSIISVREKSPSVTSESGFKKRLSDLKSIFETHPPTPSDSSEVIAYTRKDTEKRLSKMTESILKLTDSNTKLMDENVGLRKEKTLNLSTIKTLNRSVEKTTFEVKTMEEKMEGYRKLVKAYTSKKVSVLKIQEIQEQCEELINQRQIINFEMRLAQIESVEASHDRDEKVNRIMLLLIRRCYI